MLTWMKSTRSGPWTDNCVEVAFATTDDVDFAKSSFSTANAQCMEVGATPDVVYVRDSKLGDESPVLTFTPGEWTAFIEGVRAGELGL